VKDAVTLVGCFVLYDCSKKLLVSSRQISTDTIKTI